MLHVDSGMAGMACMNCHEQRASLHSATAVADRSGWAYFAIFKAFGVAQVKFEVSTILAALGLSVIISTPMMLSAQPSH